jgi:hypothetical protein
LTKRSNNVQLITYHAAPAVDPQGLPAGAVRAGHGEWMSFSVVLVKPAVIGLGGIGDRVGVTMIGGD